MKVCSVTVVPQLLVQLGVQGKEHANEGMAYFTAGERSSKSDNIGAIAGAVVGVILGLLVIAAAVVVGVFCCVRWRKPKRVVTSRLVRYY